MQHTGRKEKNKCSAKKKSFEIYFEYRVVFIDSHYLDICFAFTSVFFSLSLYRLSVCYCVTAGDGAYSNDTKRMDCARSTHLLTILMNRFPFTCALQQQQQQQQHLWRRWHEVKFVGFNDAIRLSFCFLAFFVRHTQSNAVFILNIDFIASNLMLVHGIEKMHNTMHLRRRRV